MRSARANTKSVLNPLHVRGFLTFRANGFPAILVGLVGLFFTAEKFNWIVGIGSFILIFGGSILLDIGLRKEGSNVT